jgi:hypothetical protein
MALAVFAVLLLLGAARGHGSEVTPSSAPAISTPAPESTNPDPTTPNGPPRGYWHRGGHERGFGGGGGGVPTTPPDNGAPTQTTSDGGWT